MIVVRTIFRLKFGKAKDAKALMGEIIDINKKNGVTSTRVLTDFTGVSYTLVLENSFESLADFENKLKNVFASKEYQESYQKFIPLVDSAYREIMTVVA
jgi:hypothetical protein